MWTIWIRRRQVLLGTASLVALALTPRGRLAWAAAARADDGRGVLRWSRERFPLPGSASDANPAMPFHSKHARWVLCPDDGKFYIFGGDYQSNWQGLQSGQNALLTYDPRTRVWEQAYPFWGKPGQYYPMHMDEAAVCWDSKRKLFWLTSGYQGGITGNERTKYVGIPTSGIIQAFDPIKRDWLTPFGPDKKQVYLVLGGGQHMRTVYDPARDLVLASYYDGGFGTGLMEFNPSTGEYKRNGVSGVGNFAPSNGMTNHLVGDKLYSVGGRRILETDVRSKVGRFLATLPVAPYTDGDFAYLPEIDAFWIIGEIPPTSYLVDRLTGAVSSGPELAPLKDGTPYMPTYVNRDANGVIVVGWSTSTASMGNAKSEYWHYKLRTTPDWLPAGGNAKAITTDIDGAPTNFLYDVRPTDYSNRAVYFGSGGVGIYSVTRAWASAAYARELGPNGSMLFHCGGDGDYWGNEVYAFDFSTRRFSRLSTPSHAMTGAPTGPTVDPKRDPTDPLHFNEKEIEHGPAVAEYGTGLLPDGTQPAVPHTYDGLLWLPGSVMGNLGGALVRPISSIAYTTRSTSRAHYFDLDRKKWGRLSANRLTVFSPQTPTTAYDEARQRIYHNYGYLDLASRLQVSRGWSGIPYSGVSIFDPVRRLWLHPTNSGWKHDSNPGGVNAIAVDSTSRAVGLNLAGTGWPKGLGYCGGIVYCSDLDCFFFYNAGLGAMGNFAQKIWKIQPPASSPLTNPWNVTEITMAGDTVVADARGTGQFKRIQWISPIKCLAICNGPVNAGRIYLYKPEGL